MSVIDTARTSKYISDWIRNYLVKAGLKTLIVGLSGGIDSALVALLCQRTGLPTLCVNMPCHSSPTSSVMAQAFAKDFGLNLVQIDLTFANSHLYSSILNADLPFQCGNFNLFNRVALGGFRSGLRAPLLSFYANASQGLVVGTGNRSEDKLLRYFQKVGDGCVDISPIADLFKDEVRQLFAYLATNDQKTVPSSAQQILDAKPSADLWGPDAGQEDEKELGISYEDVEWGDRENMRTSIVVSDTDPAKNPAWLAYTGHQRTVISKMHAMEKVTRHKWNPALPVCQVREVEGLVR